MDFASWLPIDDFKAEIERTVRTQPVVIITAETGAGKSTRVPVWFWQRGKRVVVTQPRRIAARSISHYVARCSAITLGEEIGYQTGLDSKKSPRTTLAYVTDGVQMVQEIRGRRDYDLLVLDEIHEWNLNQEVLVGLVRRRLDAGAMAGRAGPRVLVMSATIQSRELSSFLHDAPVLEVPGRLFPVQKLHHDPVFLLPDTAGLVEEGRNVLVFQPGKREIENFSRDLAEMLRLERRQAVILPLHAELSLRDQARVFENYPLPKVVVATDIAQTSLTIDDIDAVVDSGVKNELRTVKGIEGLYPTDIARAECLQRAGRAGRVKEGAYILCSPLGMYERGEFPEPEIRRLNLESVVLRMFTWGVSPRDFIFFHPPAPRLIPKAIENLKVFGALQDDERVSADGRRMAEWPVSLRSARLLLEAEKGGARVIDQALKVMAIFESRGIVSKDYQGERVAPQRDSLGRPSPYLSDPLTQLELWHSARENRPLVSQKKLALAREIYGELRRRLNAAAPGPARAGDLACLFRAIVSSFIDGVFIRRESLYVRGNEERELDRHSVLRDAKPEMIAGFPFDLQLKLEERHNIFGRIEERFLRLITFASELSLAQLDELRPYSYRRSRRAEVRDGQVCIVEDYHLGGRPLKSVERPPRWEVEEERELAVAQAMEWFAANGPSLKMAERVQRAAADYEEARKLLGRPLKPFADLLREYLHRELCSSLKTDDLRLFFDLHPAFTLLGLGQLLPHRLARELRRRRWPSCLRIGDLSLPLVYERERILARVTSAEFALLREEELRLPTGEKPLLVLDGKKFFRWDRAVAFYNARLRREVFDRRWRELKKSAPLGELVKIEFPLAFQGGSGKENAVFEFFCAPSLEEEGASLIHFFDREEAERYWRNFSPRWATAKRQFKKRELDEALRKKGWKVK